MRPVNLIPPEERRGDRAPLRAGKLSYVVVGGLALVLAAVTMVVMTNNSIRDREVELASLEQREADARARAEALRPYAEFASLAQARIATVASLAQSRFDWERVMRELALVLPDDVWLTALTGAASANANDAAAAAASGNSVSGPSLVMSGCADGHESVARLLQALRDIDGVTRVGLSSSAKAKSGGAGGNSGGASGGGKGAGSGSSCTGKNTASFDITVAFDGAPEVGVPATPAVPPTETVPAVPAATVESQNSIAKQTKKAKKATELIPGVAR